MDNGDIITGSSDALVRVFTKDPTRFASDDILAVYETSVTTRMQEQMKELGGVKVNDLPGPESLLQEGTEGQTRLVRQPNGKILCYQWTKGNWECVGDVMGAAGGTQATSGKKLHEGKEYDFVFNVDIEDGVPPLKLPFNTDEDPWLAAQNFIHKNDLPQTYLEQVANFIIKNANISEVPTTITEGFADPFTGGGRYVPSTNGDSQKPSNSSVNVNFRERAGESALVVNADPFTGGSSYTSGGKQEFMIQKHIPNVLMTTFDAFDGMKIIAKLKEFNSQLTDEKAKVTDVHIESISRLFSPSDEPNDEAIANFRKIMHWPNDKLFPLLDVLRLAVRNKLVCEILEPVDYIVEKLNTTAANQLMSIRALSNMLNHEYGKNVIQSKINDICDSISKISQGNGNLQNALATFLLNESIIQRDLKSDEICTILTLELLRCLEWLSDNEAIFKGYSALGNLITFNSTAASIIKSAEVLKSALERNKNSQITKLAEISTELTEKLL